MKRIVIKIKEWSKFLSYDKYTDEVGEDGIRNNTNWPSILILSFATFLAMLASGSISPTIFPYLKVIDHKTGDLFAGYINSVSAAGHVIAAIAAGVVVNKLNSVKCALIFGKITHICAAILYLSVELIPSNRRYIFLVSDFIVGIAVGAFMAGRTHVAMASSEKHRQRAFAILTLASTLGMTIGTFLNTAFASLGYPGKKFLFGLHLNLYTAPIYMSIFLNIFGSTIVILFFHGRLSLFSEKNKMDKPKVNLDKLAVALCFMVRMIVTFVMIVNSALGTIYAMAVFEWTSKETVFYHSIIHGIMGVIGLIIYILYMRFNINKWLPERKAILLALSCYFVFFVTTYPWPFYKSTIKYAIKSNATAMHGNSTHMSGCNPSYKWCAKTPAVNVWVYNVALIVLLGLGSPVLNVNLDILFSKVLGPIKQGTMQGLFYAFGSGFSIFGPILVSFVYVASGPRFIWMFVAVALIVGFIIIVVFYRRFVPYSAKFHHSTKSSSFDTKYEIKLNDIKIIMSPVDTEIRTGLIKVAQDLYKTTQVHTGIQDLKRRRWTIHE